MIKVLSILSAVFCIAFIAYSDSGNKDFLDNKYREQIDRCCSIAVAYIKSDGALKNKNDVRITAVKRIWGLPADYKSFSADIQKRFKRLKEYWIVCLIVSYDKKSPTIGGITLFIDGEKDEIIYVVREM